MFLKHIIKLLSVFSVLFILVNIHSANGQCLSVNIGVIIDQNADPCKGPITLDAHYPGYNHTWNTGALTQTITVTVSDTFIVMVDNGMGCSGTDTIMVTFLESPMIELGPDPAPQCGGCISLNAAGGSGLDYLWSTGATSENIQFCQTGTTTVSVKATNNLGCTTKDSVTINIAPGISVDLGPDISTCEEEIELTTNLSGYNHVWNTGATSPDITVTLTDTFYVDVNDGLGCVGSDTVIVNFLPRPVISLGADPAVQCGGCVTLDAGLNPGLTYSWSNGQSGNQISYCTPGTNQVHVTATNSNGCTDADTVTVTILSGFTFSLGNDITVCSGPVNLNAPNFSSATYVWNTGETTQGIQVSSAGTYYVKIYNLSGCSSLDTLSDTIQVLYDVPLNAPGEINDLSTCNEKKYSATPVSGATSYIWTVPNGATIASGQGTSSIVIQTEGNVIGNIAVTANTNHASCTSTETIIAVNLGEHPLNIPNAFSPNNDALNDSWVMRNIEIYPDNELVILNRWGNEVYRKKNYHNDWDGSSLNEGTYFYKLTIRFCEEEKTISDYVTIVR